MSKASDIIAVVGNIDPDAYTAGTVTSGWIDAAEFADFLAVVQAGTLGSSGTLDAKIEEATDSGGSGATAISGLAITQLTQADTDSDKQAAINVKPSDLDVAGGFTHFRLSMTTAVATSDSGGFVLGIGGRYQPASDNDASTVDEIVG